MGDLNTPAGFATSLACTVSNVAKAIDHADFGFTAAQLQKADAAIVTASQDVLFTEDGATDPVIATLRGHPLSAGTLMFIDGGKRVRKLRFIRKGAADAVVVITLEKYSAA